MLSGFFVFLETKDIVALLEQFQSDFAYLMSFLKPIFYKKIVCFDSKTTRNSYETNVNQLNIFNGEGG